MRLNRQESSFRELTEMIVILRSCNGLIPKFALKGGDAGLTSYNSSDGYFLLGRVKTNGGIEV